MAGRVIPQWHLQNWRQPLLCSATLVPMVGLSASTPAGTFHTAAWGKLIELRWCFNFVS